MRLGFTPEAIGDLQRLRAFIAEKNPAAAARIAERLVTGIDRLTTFPALGRPVDQAPDPERIRDLILGDYTVRYLLLDSAILVLRLWHQREDHPEA